MLLFFGLIEGLGYRQLTVWYRLQAFWKFMKKSEDWGVMTRKGFGTPEAK
ncbi:MAG: hypothetical protein ABIT20_05350 [Gemmatimonadaceae bacterium]